MGVSKKPTPLTSRTCSDSKSIFMRERFILNVANLRYALDIISILTPYASRAKATTRSNAGDGQAEKVDIVEVLQR
jgi:hypothetical protein